MKWNYELNAPQIQVGLAPKSFWPSLTSKKNQLKALQARMKAFNKLALKDQRRNLMKSDEMDDLINLRVDELTVFTESSEKSKQEQETKEKDVNKSKHHCQSLQISDCKFQVHTGALTKSPKKMSLGFVAAVAPLDTEFVFGLNHLTLNKRKTKTLCSYLDCSNRSD